MPNIANTVRRNGVYHFRLRIPQDLLDAYFPKKEITFSLKTSVAIKARELVAVNKAKYIGEFKEKRRKSNKQGFDRSLADLSEAEMINIALRWLRNEDRRDAASDMPDDIDEAIKVRRSLKTKNSKRKVPVHPTLVGIGFLKHVESVRSSGGDHLFPGLDKGAQDHYSHGYSKWFARFLDSRGITDRKLNFHSFRHTFRDAIEDAKIPMHVVNEIGGWKQQGTANEVYGSGPKELRLDDEMKKVEFPGLDLSHIDRI